MSTEMSAERGSETVRNAGAETKLGEIRGDRMCLKCGFNLHGQTIIREPHYRLLIVRCPECATVSGLQEYPVLGAWGKRWGLVFAALYIVVVLVLLIGSGLAAGGFSIVMEEETLRQRASSIANAHQQWFADTGQEKAIAAMYPSPTPREQAQISETINRVKWWGSSAAVSESWWQSEGKALAARGFVDPGEKPRIAPEIIFGSSLVGFAGVMMGMLCAVVMSGLRGWRLLAIPAAMWIAGALLAWPVTTAMFASWNLNRGANFLPGFKVGAAFALESTVPFLWAWVLTGVLVAVAAGTQIGRPFARLVVRTFLPRRSAAALSILWEADGKRFPGVRPSVR